LRAVTVRQPWAWAIARGFKDIENRSWYPRLDPGDELAIHAAAAAPTWEDVQRVTKLLGRRTEVPEEFDCGCVVATARFVRAVEASRSRWFGGPIGWVLERVKPLREPVDCKGQLGLWSMPARVERRVVQQTGRRSGPSRRASKGRRRR
jgi:hypothetical protein